MFKKIIVIRGGSSQEREISLKSGKAIAEALSRKGYEVVELDPAESHFVQEILDFDPEAAYLALHGRGGEDGNIQGFLETLKIPYTGSSVASSVICFDKILTKQLIEKENILTPQYWTDKSEVSYPLIVKPNKEGSTLGIYKVYDESQIDSALFEAKKFGGDILLEELIEGREVTVAVDEDQVYPIVEIIPQSGFYDFDSKYTPGSTDYVVPSKLEYDLKIELENTTRKIYDLLGCAGAVRADYMIREDKPYFLEINTIPGMTETSLLPKAAQEVGIEFDDLCKNILEKASLKFHE